MSCENYQMLMADALGNELAESDRRNFEDHLATCESCRNEYASARKTVQMLQSLPQPQELEHAHDHMEWTDSKTATATTGRSHPLRRFDSMRFLRQAASIALAFTAGFGVNGLWNASRNQGNMTTLVQQSSDSSLHEPRAGADPKRPKGSRRMNDTFEAAVARAQSARPDRSTWFNTVSAMYSTPQ